MQTWWCFRQTPRRFLNRSYPALLLSQHQTPRFETSTIARKETKMKENGKQASLSPTSELNEYAESMRVYLAKSSKSHEKSPEFCWKDLDTIRKSQSGNDPVTVTTSSSSKSKLSANKQSTKKNFPIPISHHTHPMQCPSHGVLRIHIFRKHSAVPSGEAWLRC